MKQPANLTRSLWIGAMIWAIATGAAGQDEDAPLIAQAGRPAQTPLFMLGVESIDELDNDICVVTLDDGYGYCSLRSKRRVHSTCQCGGFSGRVAGVKLFRHYRATLKLAEIPEIPAAQ